MHARTALLLLLAPLTLASADNIHLQNGGVIVADSAREKGDQLEYVVGATRYSIPKASVRSVEAGSGLSVSIGVAPAEMAARGVAATVATTAPAGTHRQNAGAIPELHDIDERALMGYITKWNGVDESSLSQIESEGNRSKAVAAYFLAARYAYQHNDTAAARRYMKRCVSFLPDQPALIDWYALLLIDAGQWNEAIAQARQAVGKAPQSADALRVLGLAYYEGGRNTEAIKTWKQAQQIQPSEIVALYLAKADREAAIEDHFNEGESTHFLLRYDGSKAGFGLRTDMLRTLERQYTELARDLGFSPESAITLIVYTERQFFDVTQAPAWAGALNDGKLRIPVRDVSSMTPALEMVLKHELTHSFVHSIAGGRCPTWLNEGLAQLEEPKTIPSAAELGEVFRQHKAAPLRVLEHPFLGLTPAQAWVAYAESLAATDYLRATYGMNALRRILELLREGRAPEAALREVTHNDYSQLETGLAGYLAARNAARQ